MKNSNQVQTSPQVNARCMPDDARTVLVGALEHLISRIARLSDEPGSEPSSQQWLAEQQAIAAVLLDIAQADDKEVFLRDWIINAHELLRGKEPSC